VNKNTRKPRQIDLFLPLPVLPKSTREVMEYNFFDLAKNGKKQEIFHSTSNGSSIHIRSLTGKGIANMYDYNVLLFLGSKIVNEINNGNPTPSKTVKFSGYEYNYFINKRRSGGDDHRRLWESLESLKHTEIKTNFVDGKKSVENTFSWISDFGRCSYDGRRSYGYKATVPQFLYNQFCSMNVLALDEEFFQIKSSLSRWIYLFCRKALGRDKHRTWTVHFRDLYRKSSSSSKYNLFCFNLRKIISKQSLPSYWLEENEKEKLLIQRTRKALREPKEKLKEDNIIDIFGKIKSLFKD